MKRIWIPQAIAGVMLLWALNPANPYGYYILLRWVCCAAFTYLALKAHSQGKEGWVWVLGVMAVIYNPIIRIHLTREIWSAVNIATLVIALSSIFAVRSLPAPAEVILDHSDLTSSVETRNENQ
jgi:FtsH-binding integral membrane protein